jgi:hypothetical protein
MVARHFVKPTLHDQRQRLLIGTVKHSQELKRVLDRREKVLVFDSLQGVALSGSYVAESFVSHDFVPLFLVVVNNFVYQRKLYFFVASVEILQQIVHQNPSATVHSDAFFLRAMSERVRHFFADLHVQS